MKSCWLCKEKVLTPKANPFIPETLLCLGCHAAVDEAFDEACPAKGQLFQELLSRTGVSERELEKTYLSFLVTELERNEQSVNSEDTNWRLSEIKRLRKRIAKLT